MKTFSFPKSRKNLAEIERAAMARAAQNDVNYELPNAGIVEHQPTPAPEETKTGTTEETEGQKKTGKQKKKA